MKISSSIEDEAADWLVRCNEGLPPEEETRFHRWRLADRRHASAYAELEQTWAVLRGPRRTGQTGQLTRVLDERKRKRSHGRKVRIFAGVGIAAALVLGVLSVTTGLTPFSNRPTFTVRPNQQTLPDGSVVELNSGAEILVSFSPDQRGVRLLRGEALFIVAKNAVRPFVVTAGAVEVLAVGTAFAVRQDVGHVGVLVTEGRVAVERVPAQAAQPLPSAEVNDERVYLGAGDRLVVPADLPVSAPMVIRPVTPEEMALALAWRGKRIEFTGTPMAEAVELLNRQNRIQLSIADSAVARIRLSGVFWADDPEGFVRLLENGMNVRAERSPEAIVLRRR
jgi:transmembrane sensor